MSCSRLVVSCVALASLSAQAGEGLQLPDSQALWPALQARISVQTIAPSLGASGLAALPGAAGAGSGGVQGGALFGDYYFARPSFGGFRATSGLVLGGQSGLPLASASSDSRWVPLGLAVSGSLGAAPMGSDGWTPQPYLGVGFSSRPGSAGGWSLSADLGLVAEGSVNGLRRALGVQGLENMRRELRLSPLLQVGWRTSF